MKTLLLIALALASPAAFAAITLDTELAWQGSTPITSATFSTSTSAGEDIIVETSAQANPSSGTPTSADVVFKDSVDNVNFIACGFRWNATNGEYVGVYHHQAIASGSRTVTASSTVSVFNKAAATVFTGWTGTPTCDGVMVVVGGSNTTAATAALTPATTGQNNEVAVYSIISNTFSTTPATGYTLILSSGPTSAFNIQATAGTSVPVSITWNASSIWDGILTGVYDAPASASPAKQFLVQ